MVIVSRRVWVLILFVGLLLPQLYLWRWTVDDAFISFRYLRNLAAGQGLVFNAGERVEGFSHPLWILLLAPAAFISPLVLLAWTKILGLLCTLATGICLLRLLEKTVATSPGFTVPLLLWLFSAGTHVYASSGLETPLFALLLTWSIERQSVRAPLWQSALLVGLAGITRPEAPLYILAWLASLPLSGTKRAESRQHLVTAVLIALAPSLIWLLFRLTYYHALLPNTFFAKPPGTFGGKLGLAYMIPILAACNLPLLLLGYPSAKTHLRTSAAFCIASLVFVAYTQGDWMPFWRFLMPVWPAALLQLGAGMDSLSSKLLPARKVAAATLALGGLIQSTPIPSYVRGDGLNDLMHGTHQLEAGNWLAAHVRPSESVATVRLGGIGWMLPHNKVLDMAGLTDSSAAHHLWLHKGSIAWTSHPFAQMHPDWIAAVHQEGQTIYQDDDALTRDLQQNYTMQGSTRQGPGTDVQFFHRKLGCMALTPHS